MNEKLKFLSNKICTNPSSEETLELLDITKNNSKNSNLIKLVDEIHTKLESQIYNKSKLKKTTFTMSFKKDLVSPPDVEKEPKYFKEFKELMLNFIEKENKRWEEQRKFNECQLKFNEFVLDVFNRNNLK